MGERIRGEASSSTGGEGEGCQGASLGRLQCRRQPGGSDGQPAGGSQDWHCFLKRSEEEKSSQTCWRREKETVFPGHVSGEAGPVEQKQVKGSVWSRRKQRDCGYP